MYATLPLRKLGGFNLEGEPVPIVCTSCSQTIPVEPAAVQDGARVPCDACGASNELNQLDETTRRAVQQRSNGHRSDTFSEHTLPAMPARSEFPT